MYSTGSSSPVLTNCTLSADIAQEISDEDLASSAVVTYSDIQAGYSGVGNINADPPFSDPSNRNYNEQ